MWRHRNGPFKKGKIGPRGFYRFIFYYSFVHVEMTFVRHFSSLAHLTTLYLFNIFGQFRITKTSRRSKVQDLLVCKPLQTSARRKRRKLVRIYIDFNETIKLIFYIIIFLFSIFYQTAAQILLLENFYVPFEDLKKKHMVTLASSNWS